MIIYLAADHAGFALKETIKKFLTDGGYQVEDLGNFKYDENDDYPDFVRKAAEAVANNPEQSRAIVFGGSGQGEAMVANRYKGVRAAVFYVLAKPVAAADVTGRESNDLYEIIRLTREHNDSNILCLGARFIKEKDALKAVKLWLETPFSSEERHRRRIAKF